MDQGILGFIERELRSEGAGIEDQALLLENIEKLRQQKMNILFVGATGAGKSSTINM